MTQEKLMRLFAKRRTSHGVASHCGFTGTRFYNYSTLICEIDQKTGIAYLNTKKYSRTTSKIQTQLYNVLIDEGYDVVEYEGPDAYLWNAGYTGAPALKARDFRPGKEEQS